MYIYHLPNALQIEIFSSNAINGITINEEPKPEMISENVSPCWMISPLVSFRISGNEKAGNPNAGIPDGMSPMISRSYWPDRFNEYDINAVNTTKMAFREVPVSQIILLTIRWNADFDASSSGPIFTDTNERIRSRIMMQERPMNVSVARKLWIF